MYIHTYVHRIGTRYKCFSNLDPVRYADQAGDDNDESLLIWYKAYTNEDVGRKTSERWAEGFKCEFREDHTFILCTRIKMIYAKLC